jgi:hypothetical protein
VNSLFLGDEERMRNRGLHSFYGSRVAEEDSFLVDGSEHGESTSLMHDAAMADYMGDSRVLSLAA